MAYQYTKSGELVISGWEKGIAASPEKGIANIQNGNISTFPGEVMCSFDRVLQSQKVHTAADLTVTASDSSHVIISGTVIINAGTWVSISGSTITNLADGTYYVLSNNVTSGKAQLSRYYNGTALSTLGTTGTATLGLFSNMGSPVDSTTEIYNNGTQVRYYVIDSNGLVWVYDTATADASNRLSWFLPDTSTSYFQSNTAPSGIAVLQGWLMVFSGNTIYTKQTTNLGGTTSTTNLWNQVSNVHMNSSQTTTNPHKAFVSSASTLYFTDGQFIASLYPNIGKLSTTSFTIPNIQSFCKYTASTGTGTVSTVISGSLPTTGVDSSFTGFSRIPVVFFTDQAGTQPTNLTSGVVYYINFDNALQNFTVYNALTGGSQIADIATGAVGNQYFNTFYPLGTHASPYGDTSTCTYSAQSVILPPDIATCITEIGTTLIIGAKSNNLYSWDQLVKNQSANSIINLPEANTVKLLTVNNMAYAFSGNKGNIYITNGSTSSRVLTVPDYCAGVPGMPASYMEPYFSWGDAMYLRGRVYFSILDQTSTKAGNCGGIWSFVPTQNLYIGQDTGIALRLENESSSLTYSGYCPVLIASQNQNAQSPQFWSGWQNSYSVGTSTFFGIDFTGTTVSVPTIIETDLVPTGTLLDKKTFSQIEYKLAAPLSINETVSIKYRQDATSAWTSCGTAVTESSTALSGFYNVNFEKGQWLQLQITLTAVDSAVTGNSSLCRLTEIYIR